MPKPIIYLILLSYFLSLQAQKKDTLYISYKFNDTITRLVTYKDYPNSKYLKEIQEIVKRAAAKSEKLFNGVYRRSEKEFYEKNDDDDDDDDDSRGFWIFDFNSIYGYCFFHYPSKHQKKELSQSEVQKLKVLQVPVILSETLEEAYPGFNEKADAFYHSKEQEEKREAPMKKKAKNNNNQGFTRVVIPYVPPPTYLTFCKFYIVETTAEGRYFLYEVACAYDPYAPYE